MFIRKKIISGAGGFTLIELAVTVAIVGIMSSFAITGYLSWKPGYVFRGAVSQVRADLNRAKMRAVETRRQCRVRFMTDEIYWLEDGNTVMASNNWGNIDANGTFTPGTPFRVRNFDSYPQITATDSGGGAIAGKTISFSPRGTATLDSFDIVHSTGKSALVAVNITGRINITW